MSWLSSIVGWLGKPFAPPAPPTPAALLAQAQAAAQTEPPPPGRWRRALLWTLHVVVVVLIVVALWYVNRIFDLGRALRSGWPLLHPVWLPLLFLLFYALCWLGWSLWRLLGPERPPGTFTDIEDAWTSAMRELRQAGLALSDAPVFLILGRPAAPFEQFFAASRLPLQVRHSPGPDAPLHVYANREAIYVTCEGASLLGRQATLLVESQAEEEKPVAMLGGPSAAKPEGGADLVRSRTTVLLLGEEDAVRPTRAARPALLKNETEVALGTARLHHVCRLLVRDRHPFCPVNGVIVVLPLAATDSPDDATQTGAACRHDLATARSALGVDCPRLVVLCDMERVPGFTDLARLHLGPAGSAPGNGQAGPAWVVGRHFPLLPDLGPAPSEWPLMVEGGLSWLSEALLPHVVYKWIGSEADLASNARLFRLLHEGRERLRHLARLLGRGLRADESDLPLFGGCYLAATGPDAEREQAFLPGVFRRAIDNQNYVSWTKEALTEDADYRRWAWLGYLGLVAFVVALVALVVSWVRSA